jgi:acyl-CoA synthetase (NDP forming)
MNIHEYQAKDILRKYGVAVLNGKVATTPDEAEAAAKALGGGPCVVKAQIHDVAKPAVSNSPRLLKKRNSTPRRSWGKSW